KSSTGKSAYEGLSVGADLCVCPEKLMYVTGLSLLPNGLITLQPSFAVEKNRFFRGAGMLPLLWYNE
ncbi:MAG TPA: hypothetical protein PK813_13420, partial [Candidatus Hydrogenedens sp.]|nr:hypothetical protein [Candidatus Hydrogenedens sp.]